ncbi:phage terminase small subunit-related protein [Clostridium sp.]
MPRQRSSNRDRAFEIYKEHGGNIADLQTVNCAEYESDTNFL